MTGPRLLTEQIDLDTIAVGDHVTSRWTRGATIWTVTHVGYLRRPGNRWEQPYRLLSIQSTRTTAGRAAHTDRSTTDLVKVIALEGEGVDA